ncbi:MAG: CBASS oligonucleotide cyclase [Rhodospirillales bacterium]
MAGGGGRDGPFTSDRSPEKLKELVRKAEDKAASAEFEAKLSDNLGELLSGYNGRDTELVTDRLSDLKRVLEGEIEGTLDQLYGGSVAKHTYVDGLSDIDSLVLIDGTDLEDKSPHRVIEKLRNLLVKSNSDDLTITSGKMAVTVEYPDGMQIQLLPALRTDAGLAVPSSRHEGWSSIKPQAFQSALTRRNEECGGKLVPAIKLAKAVIATLPESQRLSGYHIESLAIAAFRGYDGPKTTTAMLPTFFEKAKDLVKAPIRDSTGQSVHVDTYLGGENSQQRQSTSHVLDRLARRMRNATAAGSIDQWLSMFETEF